MFIWPVENFLGVINKARAGINRNGLKYIKQIRIGYLNLFNR